MRSQDLVDDLMRRLSADLRTRPGDSHAILTLDENGWAMVSLIVDGIQGGGTGVSITPNDPSELTHAQAQKMLADDYRSVVDNAWPDQLLQPWPLCPAHEDHPLQPGIHGSVASWTCNRDESIAIPLGELTNPLDPRPTQSF